MWDTFKTTKFYYHYFYWWKTSVLYYLCCNDKLFIKRCACISAHLCHRRVCFQGWGCPAGGWSWWVCCGHPAGGLPSSRRSGTAGSHRDAGARSALTGGQLFIRTQTENGRCKKPSLFEAWRRCCINVPKLWFFSVFTVLVPFCAWRPEASFYKQWMWQRWAIKALPPSPYTLPVLKH